MTIKQIENKIDILNHSLGLELETYTYNKETKKILQSKDSKLTIDNQIILGLQSNAYINSVLY